MNMLDTVKGWLRQISEVGLLVIAAAVVLELIFGPSVPFIGTAVVGNISGLVSDLGGGGLVGIITLGVLYWLARR